MKKKIFVMFEKILALLLFVFFVYACSSGKQTTDNVDSNDSIYQMYLKANKFDSSTIKYIKNQYLIDLLVNASKNEQIGLYHQAIIDLLDAYRFDSSKVILYAIAKNFYMIEKLTLAFDYAIKSYAKDTNFTPTIELLAWILLARNQPVLARYFSNRLINLRGNQLTYDDLKLHLEILDKIDTTLTQSIEFLNNFSNKQFEDYIDVQLHWRYYLRNDSLNEITVLKRMLSKERNLEKVDLIYIERYISLLSHFGRKDEVFEFLPKVFQKSQGELLDNFVERILNNLNEYDKQISGFSNNFIEILEQNASKSPNGNYNLIRAYVLSNDTIKAHNFARKILNDEEIDLNTLIAAAKVLFYNAGEKENALKKLSSFKMKFMAAPAYYITLGEFYFNLSNYDLAAANFEKALSLDSFYTEPYSYLGDIYFAKEDWKKSDFYYSEYLKFYPNEATILNNYAYSLIIREENLPYALSMIERAIEQKPDDPNFLDTYGWYFYKVGQYEEARKYIEKSIQIDSSRAEPFLHLSLIYKALGDETKAKENFEKAVSIDPNNKEIIKEMNKTK